MGLSVCDNVVGHRRRRDVQEQATAALVSRRVGDAAGEGEALDPRRVGDPHHGQASVYAAAVHNGHVRPGADQLNALVSQHQILRVDAWRDLHRVPVRSRIDRRLDRWIRFRRHVQSCAGAWGSACNNHRDRQRGRQQHQVSLQLLQHHLGLLC